MRLSPDGKVDDVTTLEIDPVAKELGDRFQAAGHELYLVGGVVRDLVMGRLAPGVDTDFATDASPAETSRLLRGWADALYLVGAKFGTVGARRHGNVLEIGDSIRINDGTNGSPRSRSRRTSRPTCPAAISRSMRWPSGSRTESSSTPTKA